MFFLDMKSPGVEVRPIKQANGMQEFNEVYFSDVVIPDHQRLGAVGDGWNVSLTTPMNERMSIGSRPGPPPPPTHVGALGPLPRAGAPHAPLQAGARGA